MTTTYKTCTFEGCTLPAALNGGRTGLTMCIVHDAAAARRLGTINPHPQPPQRRRMTPQRAYRARKALSWLTPRELRLARADTPRLPIGQWAITLGVRYTDGTPTQLGEDVIALANGFAKIVHHPENADD